MTPFVATFHISHFTFCCCLPFENQMRNVGRNLHKQIVCVLRGWHFPISPCPHVPISPYHHFPNSPFTQFSHFPESIVRASLAGLRESNQKPENKTFNGLAGSKSSCPKTENKKSQSTGDGIHLFNQSQLPMQNIALPKTMARNQEPRSKEYLAFMSEKEDTLMGNT